MFQTFTGSSRRPRQVNLSGQNLNPFTATPWDVSVSGTQQTIAHAQQERLQRQRERSRIDAASKIQRAWRGHKTRQMLANQRRKEWDDLEIDIESDLTQNVNSLILSQSRLLVSFYNSHRKDDLERIRKMSLNVSKYGLGTFLASINRAQYFLVRLVSNLSRALQSSLPSCPLSLLKLLVAIIESYPRLFSAVSKNYYSYLSALSLENEVFDQDMFLTALRIPLLEHIDEDDSYELLISAYASFGTYFLKTPDLKIRFSGLTPISSIVNVNFLSSAMIREVSTSRFKHLEPESKLWLLAHFIAIIGLQQKSLQGLEFLRALSLLLSASSTDIIGRADVQNSNILQETVGIDGPKKHVIPLSKFILDEILSLVTQDSISMLLTRFSINHENISEPRETNISLLASYTLTLLRIFPSRGDEIRLWLYLGSIKVQSDVSLPALKFLWQAMRSTNTFSMICNNSKSALAFLHRAKQDNIDSSVNFPEAREWCTILLFLELYTFVLRFTDDEEFLSGSVSNFDQNSEPMSRLRKSALPIDEVKRLTLFLRNLAFTIYYYSDELTDVTPIQNTGTTGAYFDTISSSSSSQLNEAELVARSLPNRLFAGIAGITFSYVKIIITGVMRMLYERDSRRQFLPKDHWLMTSKLEMNGFIPAVVMEEESQHEVEEMEGDQSDESGEVHHLDNRESSPISGTSGARRALYSDNLRKAQQKLARQKVLAAVGPRLRVLQNMPFVIPFETRVQIFRQFVIHDQTRRRGGNVDPDTWRLSAFQSASNRHNNSNSMQEFLGRHHAKIRRNHIFEDAYQQFYGLGDGLKEPIQITFVDQFDTVEAGIDGGGVAKEFLTSVTNEALLTKKDPKLFVTNDQNLLYPNPNVLEEKKESLRQLGFSDVSSHWRDEIRNLLKQYEFLGRIIGKCLYEGILVDIGFAGFFLLKWAASGASGSDSGYRANINDLRDLDESLYQGLLKLKNFPGDVEDFSLDFTIIDNISLEGRPIKSITRELMPNGSAISVTNENKLLYVSYVARHRLHVQPYQQTQAFLKGLGDVINTSWISMFNQSELQTLIGGDSSEIDIDDLRQNTLYGGVYQIGDDGEEHYTIKLFWNVMNSLHDADRKKVLKYVTSTPRAPLLGFSQLNPRFSIRDSGSDEERLPSTSTCVNLLKLPRYSNENVLKQKLLYAINSGAGFDLS
ncbi:hypothetical protein K3495_g1733 [Podosphaera aphanis]|nr:hypothetical protein K3495_g1733 [Podosphaera aphanis]